ncbi:MAG: hypothetical protein WCF12_13820 [Propionicimonas sp.]
MIARYTALLAGLDPTRTLVKPVANRVAWLSGRSEPGHGQLSPAQCRLVVEVAPVGFEALAAAFPYHTGLVGAWQPAPLGVASVRNTLQFVAARRDPAFRNQLVRHLSPLVERTRDRLLVICGSAGLELLLAALPDLPLHPGLRLGVVALGPVSRRPPSWLPVHVLQGRTDVISRLGYRGPADAVPCGHLGYATSPAVRARIRLLAEEFAHGPAAAGRPTVQRPPQPADRDRPPAA